MDRQGARRGPSIEMCACLVIGLSNPRARRGSQFIVRGPKSNVSTAPSAPRSEPPAATLSGGLRPGSLRVHAPCKEAQHGSRLGFPGRRLPRGPAAPGNVARALQVLPQKARRGLSGGRGELGLDPAEPGLRPAGVPPPERSAGGGGRLADPRCARRGSTRLHPTAPWNSSAGEDPLPEPCRTEGPKVLCLPRFE